MPSSTLVHLIIYYFLSGISVSVMGARPRFQFPLGQSQAIPPAQRTIKENTTIGTELFQLRATDADGDKLDMSVTLCDAFAFNATKVTQPDSSSSFVFTFFLKVVLNRELLRDFRCLFTVTEDATSKNSASVAVTFKVYDNNDNTPTFTKVPYSRELPEDTKPGTDVFTVTAEDGDATPPLNRIGFKLIGGNEDNKFVLTSFRNNTGAIQLVSPLDFESKKVYQLKVLVEDIFNTTSRYREPRLNSTQYVLINVKDVDDTPPHFLNPTYSAEFYENATVPFSPLAVSAVDGDIEVNHEVKYMLLNPGEFPADRFSIDAVSGQLILEKSLKYDANISSTGGVIVLEVVAQEVIPGVGNNGTGGDKSGPQKVTLTVLDVNDHRPEFSLSQINGSVEELSPWSAIFEPSVIEVCDRDSSAFNKFEVSVHEQNGRESHILTVLPKTLLGCGTISLSVNGSSRLDYESQEKSIQAWVIATDSASGLSSNVSVTLTITDANDHSPVFNQSTYQLSVQENLNDTVSLGRVSATDEDTVFGDVRFELQDGLGLFVIDNRTGELSAACNQTSCFDYESVVQYSLRVIATDNGGRSSAVQVTVSVSDLNDMAPIFSQTVYTGSIAENSRSFTSPVTVEAKDGDQPNTPQSTVSYTIDRVDPRWVMSSFEIDHSSGSLTVLKSLDAESLNRPSVLLYVIASDGGNPVLTSEARISLSVADENDNSPYFTSQMSQSVFIFENEELNKDFFKVEAHDNDTTSPNNNIIYSSTDEHGKFQIDAFDGSLKVVSPLDRETHPSHIITVTATDGGRTRRSSNVTVNVTVVDVNDEQPLFVKTLSSGLAVAEFSVNESAYIGTLVGHVAADDPDLNSSLLFSVSNDLTSCRDDLEIKMSCPPGFGNWFTIDSVNGTIYTSDVLDWEEVPIVHLYITVTDTNTDSSAPSGRDKTQPGLVSIKIKDVNDNAPKFSESNITITDFTESNETSVLLRQVTATDPDEGLNSQIKYSLTGTDKFGIDEDGSIRSVQGVDREVTPWVNFTVLAQDSGTPSKSSSMQVFVRVQDTNDNPPIFTSVNTTVYIEEEHPSGYNVTRLIARDADEGRNAKIRYNLAAEASNFDILSANSGQLVTRRKIDRDLPGTGNFTVYVSACDEDGKCSPTNSRVVIIVTDINDNAPKFVNDRMSKNIPEDRNYNDVILKVVATDDDDGENGTISYGFTGDSLTGDSLTGDSLTKDTKLFSIDPNTGDIKARQKLGEESPLLGLMGTYRFSVIATDHGIPPKNSTANVTIMVEDVNDHPPAFVTPSVSGEDIHVLENKVGEVYKVEAVDTEDRGDNAKVIYSLSPAAPDSVFFSIGVENGSIWAHAPFDSESNKTRYELTVDATDLGNPSKSAETKLVVLIDDVDDNDPMFPTKDQAVNITWTENDGKCHSRAIPEGVDKDRTAKLCYFIVGGQTSSFVLNKTTRELCPSSKDATDRETQPTVTLYIQVVDECETGLRGDRPVQPVSLDKDQLKVVIQIVDVNDVRPALSLRPLFPVAVMSNAPASKSLLTLGDYKVDPDSVGKHTYWIIPPFIMSAELQNALGTAPFDINPDTGEITTAVKFSENLVGTIGFNVSVDDSVQNSTKHDIQVIILSEDKLVRLKVALSNAELRANLQAYLDLFSSYGKPRLESIVRDRQDPGTSYLSFYVLSDDQQTALLAKEVVELIDLNDDLRKSLMQLYVEDATEFVPPIPAPPEDNTLLVLIIVFCSALFVALLIVTLICCQMRRRYRLKLKAKRISEKAGGDFGDTNDGSPIVQPFNSNPAYGLDMDNPAYDKDGDTDSLDENSVTRDEDDQSLTDGDTLNVHINMMSDDYFDVLPSRIDAAAALRAALEMRSQSTGI